MLITHEASGTGSGSGVDTEVQGGRRHCLLAISKMDGRGGRDQGRAPVHPPGQFIKGFREEVIFELGLAAFGTSSAVGAQ